MTPWEREQAPRSAVWLAYFVLLLSAAVHRFGWLDGLGLGAGVWLLAPYRAIGVQAADPPPLPVVAMPEVRP